MKNEFLHKLLKTDSNLAALILRVPLGLVLFAHGGQKLFGWFGGYGLQGTGQWFASIGLEPGVLMALLSGSIEFFGGLALVAGVLTRVAAAASALMLVIGIFSVHIGNGLFISNNGYEYALSLAVALAALVLLGGGPLAVDRVLADKDA